MQLARRTLMAFALLIIVVSGTPALAQRIPVWATGTFSGHSSKENADKELNITERGNATMRTTRGNGKESTYSGRWRDDRLQLGSDVFNVERTGEGVRITSTSDRANRTDYRRTRGDDGGSDNSGGGDIPPSWVVG